ncbi:MAG: hypothetical protein M3N53_11235 [Actinomycetota bacterium]|nr:hypothetical protein [Actinomycetota bacterium]
MRAKVVLALTAVALLGSALPATACTCFSGDPYDALEASDGAFIGEFLFRRLAPDGYSAVYTFRVDEAIKGDLGDRIQVHSSAGGGSCGLAVTRGRDYGLLLEGSSQEGWSSGLCSQMSPGKLRQVARGLPPPDGEGPIELLVGGSLGPARVIALDAQGRTLAYGFGQGRAIGIDACPGSRRFVEIHLERRRPRLAVRETASMEIVREQELTFEHSAWWGQSVTGLRCSDPEADEIVLTSADYQERYAQSFIWLLRNNETSLLYAGTAHVDAFRADRVYMREGKRGRVLSYFDLTERVRVRVARNLPPGTGLSLSPDGTKLADVTGGDVGKLKLIDLSVDPPTVKEKRLGPGVAGSIVWLDDNTMVLLPGTYDNSKVLLFDLALRPTKTVPGHWYTLNNVLVGDTAYGAGWGDVYRVRLPDGPAELLRSFISPEIFALDVLDADVTPTP